MLSSSLIDRLIDDVLLIIFNMVVSPPDFCRSRSLNSSIIISRLKLVCRRWNILLSSSPTAWSYISTSSIAVAEACLERSQNVDLDVQFEHLFGPGKNPVQSIALLDTLLNHSHRFRQFHLFVNSSCLHRSNMVHDMVHDVHTFSAPNLHSLTLFFLSAPILGSSSAQLSTRRFPNLRKLHLRCSSIGLMPEFTRLTHMCIETSFLDVTDLVSLIQANKALEELILCNSGLEDTAALPTSTPVVEFPHLRWISLTCLPPLLDYIRTTSQQYSIVLHYHPVNSVFSFFSPVLKLAIEVSEGITFTVWNNDNHVLSLENPFDMDVLGSHDEDPFDMDVPRSSYDQINDFVLEEAAKSFSGLSTIRELWLFQCDSADHTSSWKLMLNSMPSLTCIFIAEGPSRFIVAGLMPDESDNTLCHKLEGLYMTWTQEDSDELFEMVELRDRCGVRLRTLQLCCLVDMELEVLDKLKQHVDEVRVVLGLFSECMPQMDIPRQFTGYRHEQWG